jgi:hypothetical protein
MMKSEQIVIQKQLFFTFQSYVTNHITMLRALNSYRLNPL